VSNQNATEGALQEHNNELMESVSNLKQGINDQIQYTIDWSHDMLGAVHACGQGVMKHMTNDIKEDMPTGKTHGDNDDGDDIVVDMMMMIMMMMMTMMIMRLRIIEETFLTFIKIMVMNLKIQIEKSAYTSHMNN